MTMRLNWGYDRDDENWKSEETLVDMLVLTAPRGANMILNVGPQPDGDWTTEEKNGLQAIGQWLKRNGESIHGTQASPFDWDFPWGTLTTRGNTLYLHVLERPDDGRIAVTGLTNKATTATLIGDPALSLPLESRQDTQGFTVDMSQAPKGQPVDVVRVAIEGPAAQVSPGATGRYHFKSYEQPLMRTPKK